MSGYQGSTHTDVNMSVLVWQIANKSAELDLQNTLANWDANLTAWPVADILTVGYRKFLTSSLATFNKKLADTRRGRSCELEVDEISPCQVMEGGDTDDTEPGEMSALHEEEDS